MCGFTVVRFVSVRNSKTGLISIYLLSDEQSTTNVFTRHVTFQLPKVRQMITETIEFCPFRTGSLYCKPIDARQASSQSHSMQHHPLYNNTHVGNCFIDLSVQNTGYNSNLVIIAQSKGTRAMHVWCHYKEPEV